MPTDHPRALRPVLDELSPPLLRHLRRCVGDAALAEDLLQETLLRIERGWAQFEERSSAKTWAYAIAARVVADHFRRPENSLEIVEIDDVEEAPDQEDLAEDRLLDAEMNACIRQVVDSLPPDYRTALVLHDLDGLSAADVAEICACSLATAKIRIHRARRRLRGKLEHQCTFERGGDGILRCDRKARRLRRL